MAKDKRPMMVKIGDSTFDKIQAFYIDPEKYPLSTTLEKIRQRWIVVMTLQLKVYPKWKIANMLEKDFGLSQAQAYIDIRNAENIFGNVIKTDNEAFKTMWVEWTKDYLKRSRQSGDKKSEGKALDLLAKYGGLSEDVLEFNSEKLEKKEITINLPKEILPYLIDLIGKGVVDLNALDVTDVKFEEVNDEKEN
jgi:hypothetical protein